MSMTKKVNVTCPICETKGEMDIWESINVTINPELKERIFNRELFTYKCPKCGERVMVAYDCLYHDMVNKTMIYLTCEDGEADIFKTNDKGMDKLLRDYSIRIVHNINSLIEKITLFEDRVDDRAAELCKIFLHDQYVQGKPMSKLMFIYYGGKDRDKKELTFFFISENEENSYTNLPEKMYRNILGSFNISKFANTKDKVIDFKWAIKALEGGVFKNNE